MGIGMEEFVDGGVNLRMGDGVTSGAQQCNKWVIDYLCIVYLSHSQLSLQPDLEYELRHLLQLPRFRFNASSSKWP